MIRLKYLAEVNPALPHDRTPNAVDEVSFLPMERIGENGSIDLSETRPAHHVWQGYTPMADGDVVIAKITPCFENGKGALCRGLHRGIGFGTTELIVLRAKPGHDPRYLYWLTRGYDFRHLGEAEMNGSAGQKRIPDEFVANYRSVQLSREEQRTIAAYLDCHTAKIDRLMTLRRRQMDLLREQRVAIIQQAVTRGLDLHVSMKKSGLPWQPEIPQHWTILQVRRVISFITSGSRGWAEHYSDDGDIFVQSGDLTRSMTLDLDNAQRVVPPPGAEVLRTRIERGDVLVCVTGAYTGKVALVDHDPPTAFVSQHVALLRPLAQRVDSKYLALALWSSCGQTQFKLAEYGGTKQGLGLEDMRHVVVAFPDLDEQRAIVRFIETKTATCDALHALYLRQLDFLTAYRTALIHECVTGQWRVNAVPRLSPAHE